MICKNCSTEYDGKFCPECGAAAEAAEVAEENISVSAADGDYGAPTEDVAQPTEPVEPEAQEYEQAAEEPIEPEVQDEQEYAQEGDTADEPAELPRKKRRKGPIILIIILLLLIAAFCVTAFTDLIIPKQAQFVSVLTNMGSDVDTKFESVDSDYTQTKYSFTINAQSGESTSDIIGVINSLGLVVKQSDDGAIASILEGSKELAALSAIVKDDNAYIGTNFSDLVFKVPGVTKTDMDYDEVLEKIEQIITDEIKAVLETSEVVKGKYEGEFDLGMDVNTMTITLDKNETTELVSDILRAIYAEFAPNMLADLETLIGDATSPVEISISALYDGAFSFARNSLGVSVVLDDGVDAVEFIFFSNKKDKAIYGAGCDGEWFALTDNYTISGNTQSGKLALESNMAEFDEFKGVEVTYTIGDNSLKATLSLEVEGQKMIYDISYIGASDKATTTIELKDGEKTLATILAETTPCEEFDVAIDTGKAVDIESISDTQLNKLLEDFVAHLEGIEGSQIVDMLMAYVGGGSSSDGTVFEQYMWAEYGIEFYETDFYPYATAAFVSYGDGMIDILEYGYVNDTDIVCEMVETCYIDVSGYTESEKQSIIDMLEESFAFTEEYDDAFVGVWEEGDYVVMSMYLSNLNLPERLEEFVNKGLVVATKGTDKISFKMSKTELIRSGYEMIE